MYEIYLKIKVPTKFYNKIKTLRDKYEVEHEDIDNTVRALVQHKLKGWNPGIKIELYNENIEIDNNSKVIAEGIHKRREEEKGTNEQIKGI